MVRTESPFLKGLKEEQPFRGQHVRVSATEEYKMCIIARGEQIFYQQNERAILFEIDAVANVIYRKTIRRWDDGKRVTDAERDIIIQRTVQYLSQPGRPQVTILEK